MWLDEATAASSATMTLRDVPAGRSLVITSDGKTASDLTVTMTWKTPHKNVLAIASGIIALLFLLIAGGTGGDLLLGANVNTRIRILTKTILKHFEGAVFL